VFVTMRRFVLPLLASAFLLCGACGDDDDTPGADAAQTPDADENTPDGSGGFPDAPETPDAAGPNIDGGGGEAGDIICDQAICSPPQICCVSYAGGFSFECTASDACSGAAMTCDGPEDCNTGAGEQCCVGLGNFNASCVSPCEEYTVCHTADDCPVAGENCCGLGVGPMVCSTLC